MNWLPSAVNRSGAVSPATRATESRLPVTMPGRAVRSTMVRLVRQRGYPSARAASRSEFGTSLISSSVVRMTIGTISMARAQLPARAENCLVRATMSAHANTPTTMDGVPFMTSATKRVIFASRVPEYSAQKMPAPTPRGSPIRLAMPTMIKVPTIALATPPPVSPAGTGILVKKSSEILLAPLAIRVRRISSRGSTASSTARTMRPTIALLFQRRSRGRFICRRRPGPARPAR